jgi:hypothetical protein
MGELNVVLKVKISGSAMETTARPEEWTGSKR